METLSEKDIEQFLAISSGYGDGSGSGSGYGSGSGLSSFNGQKVYVIDSVPTLIDCIHGSYARGRILNEDLTLTACFIAKVGDSFAHGSTLHEAEADARAKALKDMPEEERIMAFMRDHDVMVEYPARDLFDWHGILTGSCRMGRETFCRNHGIDVEKDSFTVGEFVRLTKDAYGGEVIRQLAARCLIDV